MKRRLVGVLLVLPAVVAIAFAVPTCTRGREIGGESADYGQVWNNVLAALLILGVPCAAIGLGLVFSTSKDRSSGS